MNEKNITFKKRPRKSEETMSYERKKFRDNVFNLLKFIINITIFFGFMYFVCFKVIPTIYYELDGKYEIKNRTTLVDVNKITFDREYVEYANSYYEALTNYKDQKNSKFMNQLKDDIKNDTSSTRFRLEQIDYKDTYYNANKINKIEYSKDVKEPKIKLIYEDKYYKTNKEGKKGQLAKKAKWPEKETKLVLPKEDDE